MSGRPAAAWHARWTSPQRESPPSLAAAPTPLGILLTSLFARHAGLQLAVPGGVPTACILLAVLAAMASPGEASGWAGAPGLRRPPAGGLALASRGPRPMVLGIDMPPPGEALGDALLLRGHAVRRLASGGLPLRAALRIPGPVFGVAHAPGARHAVRVSAGLTVPLTRLGGVWFGWLDARWGWSVRVPMTAHQSINAGCMAGATGRTAASGDWGGDVGRAPAIAVITWGTLRLTPPVRRPLSTPRPPPDTRSA